MPEEIKWGIIGPGKIAGLFAHDLLMVEGARIYAVASRDAERGRTFAESFGADVCYGSYHDLVTDPRVDVVYVATPHVFHFPHTMLALSHGKPVLCEKPLAMNEAEVMAMTGEAGKRGLFLMEALWTRFIPATGKVLELLGEGAIGEVLSVEADFGFLADTDPQKRMYNLALGGGSLMDIGIYPVYLSLLIMGLPEKIQAKATFANSRVDNHCSMVFDYGQGRRALLESTTLKNTPTGAVIRGSKGLIRMHPRFHHCKKISLQTKGKTREFEIGYRGNGFCDEIEEVMHCLQTAKTQSDKMPHSMSLDLIRTLDRVRAEIGLVFNETM